MDNYNVSAVGESANEDPRIRYARARTSMAEFRTSLALDRTTLAWIRTTLTMASFGFGMVGFFRSARQQSHTVEAADLHEAAINFGYGLVVLGILATVFAAGSHWLTLRKLRAGSTPALSMMPLTITIAMLLAVLGLAGLWSLASR